ncbi:hypothetical protein MKJ04_03755 [Pontibacter sp. E15-1]|uniref:hypothetical protein n=1 Tax=Pontibacter sp. E15-1 TaxID=2919918 RepID=UPI001F50294E|nr:hypothetical protein [Pontibacter sp. E15-1]MCJ8163943.1 hypothetical protein [Pontibacter sp. E15-1]
MKDSTLKRLLPADLYTPAVFSVAFIIAIGCAPTASIPTDAARLFFRARPVLAVNLTQTEGAPDATVPKKTANPPGLLGPGAEFDYNSLVSRLVHEAVACVAGLFCEDFGQRRRPLPRGSGTRSPEAVTVQVREGLYINEAKNWCANPVLSRQKTDAAIYRQAPAASIPTCFLYIN